MIDGSIVEFAMRPQLLASVRHARLCRIARGHAGKRQALLAKAPPSQLLQQHRQPPGRHCGRTGVSSGSAL